MPRTIKLTFGVAAAFCVLDLASGSVGADEQWAQSICGSIQSALNSAPLGAGQTANCEWDSNQQYNKGCIDISPYFDNQTPSAISAGCAAIGTVLSKFATDFSVSDCVLVATTTARIENRFSTPVCTPLTPGPLPSASPSATATQPPPPPPPPLPPKLDPNLPHGGNVAACNGSPECKTCEPSTNATGVACGTSPFVPVELNSLAATAGEINSGEANSVSARSLLSNGNPLRGGGSGSGAAGAISNPEDVMGGLSTSPILDAVGATGLGANTSGIYNGGRGRGGLGTDSTGGASGIVVLDGTGIPRFLEFAGVGGVSGSLSMSQASIDDGSSGKNVQGELDSDNSDTWTDAQKSPRLRAALEMAEDDYLRLIAQQDSIFRVVHRRYQKIQKRWLPPVLR